jgi:pimeloyl-ACP methyl ester carboxylesterase
MHGNVFEWCRDWYHADFPGGTDPDLSNLQGTVNRDGTYSRVRRGGAWNDDGWACRSALRLRYEPPRRSDHIGFRVALVETSSAPESVSLATDDGGLIAADLYGNGQRAVVLAHGGRFNKESWQPQATELAAAGFRVVAINFRGYGASRGPGQDDPLSAPLHLDVLAAVRYLRQHGAKTVAVVGGSMGAGAAADAVAHSRPGEIDRLVALGGVAGREPPEHIKTRKLFITTRDDTSSAGPRLPQIQRQFERAPEPKRLMVLEGSAHAQFIFETEQGELVLREILQFLSQP